jgi:NADH dehydrogenase ubiquinone Fe-S protein 4
MSKDWQWKLRFEPRSSQYIEPLMGWTGSDDTLSQVELPFPSVEAAVAYKIERGLVNDWSQLCFSRLEEVIDAMLDLDEAQGSARRPRALPRGVTSMRGSSPGRAAPQRGCFALLCEASPPISSLSRGRVMERR